MNALGDGWTTAAIIVVMAVVAHEPWRWVGLWVGRDLDIDGEAFRWVRAVATAMVAGLVMRLLVFPAGALADVPAAVRTLAFAAGLAIYMAAGRSLAAGVAGGSIALVVARLAFA